MDINPRYARIIRCFEEYETYAKEYLTWVWRDEPPEGPDNFVYDKAPSMREMASALSPKDLFAFSYTSGKEKYATGEWRFMFFSRPIQNAEYHPEDTDYLEFSVPVSFLRNFPHVFESMFIRFADRIGNMNGYAGYAMNLSLTREKNNQPTEANLTRIFNALDIGENLMISGRRDMRKHLKTMSWLTLLNQEMLQEVGGVTGLRKYLPEQWYAFYKDPKIGLLIQTGNYPSLVSNKEDPMLASYVLLNHALRKARLESIGPLHSVPDYQAYFLDRHTSNKWLTRFDIEETEVINYLEKLRKESTLQEDRLIPGLKKI
ncbi:DUF3396 domain-containing protein [Advenella mimigardefordensis]|uniref:DUF3396 domain-containing protein n=1 Tax=Advenella mimigardefordensis TaxID=302406 RepID=UPI0038992C35